MQDECSPSLEDFLARYRADDNEWWVLRSGDHLNLFDDLLDAYEAMKVEREGLLALMAQAQVVQGYPDVCPYTPEQGSVREWAIRWLEGMANVIRSR